MANGRVVRPNARDRRQLRCTVCEAQSFDSDYEFADEQGWVCERCGSNNFYPVVSK